MRDIEPQDYEERIYSWFAFWPVTINRETRWLETITVRQIYGGQYNWWGHSWQNIEFID